MNRCSDLRALAALLLALTTIFMASEASAHGSPHHGANRTDRGANIETLFHPIHLTVAMAEPRTAPTIGQRTQMAGHCGGAACCGSVCVTCCSLLANDVVIPEPAGSAKRVKIAKGPPQSGFGSQRIRRPPKS